MGGAWGRRGVLARERLSLWGQPVGVGTRGGKKKQVTPRLKFNVCLPTSANWPWYTVCVLGGGVRRDVCG